MGRCRSKEDAVSIGGIDVPALDDVRIPGASVPARDAVRRGEVRIRVDEDWGVGGEGAPHNRSGRRGYGGGGEEDEQGERKTVASTGVNPHSGCHDSRDAVLRFRFACEKRRRESLARRKLYVAATGTKVFARQPQCGSGV